MGLLDSEYKALADFAANLNDTCTLEDSNDGSTISVEIIEIGKPLAYVNLKCTHKVTLLAIFKAMQNTEYKDKKFVILAEDSSWRNFRLIMLSILGPLQHQRILVWSIYEPFKCRVN